MALEHPPELVESFRTLSSLLLANENVETTLARIAELSVRTIPGCDWAGISLVESGTIRTVGATDDLVNQIDDLQYETGEGPCLSAIKESERAVMFEIASMEEDTLWPEFSSRAVETGVMSLLAYTLGVPEQDVLGSLNLYARRAGAFDQEDERVGTIFAAHAAVALANAQSLARAEKRAGDLEVGLESRDLIGRAKGILMERDHCTDEEAFQVLVHVSQHLHRKLRDVAGDVVESLSDKRESEETP